MKKRIVKTDDMTRVQFKLERNPRTKGVSVFAFFPDERDRHDGENYTSYSHVGQHSLCAKSYADKCKWAGFSQYIGLYDELVYQVGYRDLKVMNPDWETMKAFAVRDDFGERVNAIEARAS